MVIVSPTSSSEVTSEVASCMRLLNDESPIGSVLVGDSRRDPAKLVSDVDWNEEMEELVSSTTVAKKVDMLSFREPEPLFLSSLDAEVVRDAVVTVWLMVVLCTPCRFFKCFVLSPEKT